MGSRDTHMFSTQNVARRHIRRVFHPKRILDLGKFVVSIVGLLSAWLVCRIDRLGRPIDNSNTK